MKFLKTVLFVLFIAITCNAQTTYEQVDPAQVRGIGPTNAVIPTNTLADALLWINQHWPTNIPNEELATAIALDQLRVDMVNTNTIMRQDWRADISAAVSSVNARIDSVLNDWPYVFRYTQRGYFPQNTGVYYSATAGPFTNINWGVQEYSDAEMQACWRGSDAAVTCPTSGMWIVQASVVLQPAPIVVTNFFSWVLFKVYRDNQVQYYNTIGAVNNYQTASGVGYNGMALVYAEPGHSTMIELVYESTSHPFYLRHCRMAIYYIGR